MAAWTFKSYLSDNGVDEFEEWLAGRPKAARAKFFERVNGLRDQPQHNWNGTRTKQLHGYDKLLEIRFKAAEVQHRPIGFFGPGRSEFTLLIGAIEKGGEFIPKSAPKEAERRRAIVVTDPRRARVYSI